MNDSPVNESSSPATAPMPRHVAIIMDGNGRWAQLRGMPRIEGHRRGVDTVRMVCEACTELKIDVLTLYCLSSENWKRPQQEIDFLMELFKQYLIEERDLIMKQDLKLQVIGRKHRLPVDVLSEMQTTLQLSANNQGTKLQLAVDYGGRDEIAQAAQAIAQGVQDGRLQIDAIDEQCVSEHLFTAGQPDVDLMIRTGGEMRVSNFLLWQLSYAELWVTETCWPEFSREDFDAALNGFAARDRRFGGIKTSNLGDV
ncbi:MAG: di-trans,poly-cis-decaprenylcistransferase [Rhodopirellula sp. TMED11]|nr:MAG: di-trans,poly-cis-decaprenylcistransferase [Rhodopirellula sp. TMED11]